MLSCQKIVISFANDSIKVEQEQDFVVALSLNENCIYVCHYEKVKEGPTNKLRKRTVALALKYYVRTE